LRRYAMGESERRSYSTERSAVLAHIAASSRALATRGNSLDEPRPNAPPLDAPAAAAADQSGVSAAAAAGDRSGAAAAAGGSAVVAQEEAAANAEVEVAAAADAAAEAEAEAEAAVAVESAADVEEAAGVTQAAAPVAAAAPAAAAGEVSVVSGRLETALSSASLDSAVAAAAEALRMDPDTAGRAPCHCVVIILSREVSDVSDSSCVYVAR
jgi:hypothetical protein